MQAPDFVAVGHVTLDETATGLRPGGAALYAAVTAHRLGCSVGLLTSFGPDFPIEVFPSGVHVVSAPAARTTTFRHEQTSRGRQLTLLSRATDLMVDALPAPWRDASLALLSPVAGEVDPYLAAEFAEAAVSAAVQGWLRQRGPGGVITPAQWDDAAQVLPHLQAVFLSSEDIGALEEGPLKWFQEIPVGIVTLGQAGALLFVNGERYSIPADTARQTDATGAGDVFAAAFLIHYQHEGDPWEAAAFAACAAASSVEVEGLAGIPDRPTLEARLSRYRKRLFGVTP
ncbi:MAG: PfkB family carbohydrate kinase [Candidatus Methylomirabilia bacterium]